MSDVTVREATAMVVEERSWHCQSCTVMLEDHETVHCKPCADYWQDVAEGLVEEWDHV